MAKKQKLGRGLASLIGEISNDSATSTSDQQNIQGNNNLAMDSVMAGDKMVAIDIITADAANPRQHFPISELEELSQSIKKYGIIQPLLVRPGRTNDANIRYKLIAGERRWRAAQRAGLHKVPVIIREVSDSQALELALIENIHRSDLNPVDEALGYKKLMDDYEYRQQDLSAMLGKSRSHIANMLRLLNLPLDVLQYIIDGKLSTAHGRALVGFKDAEAFAKKIISNKLSVRATEKYVAQHNSENKNSANLRSYQLTADEKILQQKLNHATGLKFLLKPKNSKQGKIIIQYKDIDLLNNFFDKIIK